MSAEGIGWHRLLMQTITIPDRILFPADGEIARDAGAVSAHQVLVAMEELSPR